VEWHGSFPWRGKLLHGGSKLMSRTCPMSKRRISPAKADDVLELDAHLELCAEERAKTLAVDSDVPPNAADCGLCHR
jgi:hypothetical protein